jgi:hypothetical protein
LESYIKLNPTPNSISWYELNGFDCSNGIDCIFYVNNDTYCKNSDEDDGNNNYYKKYLKYKNKYLKFKINKF